MPHLPPLGTSGSSTRSKKNQARFIALHKQYCPIAMSRTINTNTTRHYLFRKASFFQLHLVSGNGMVLSTNGSTTRIGQLWENYHRLAVWAWTNPWRVASAGRTISSRVQRFQQSFPCTNQAPEITRKYIDANNYTIFLGNTDPKKNTPRVLKAYSDYLKQSTQKLPLLIADLKGDVIDRILEEEKYYRNQELYPRSGIHCEYRPCSTLLRCIRIPLSIASREFRHPDAGGNGLRNAHHCGKHISHARNCRRGSFTGRSVQLQWYYWKKYCNWKNDQTLYQQQVEYGIQRSQLFFMAEYGKNRC